MVKMFAPHMTDGYKLGHAQQYVEGTSFLYSNLTPRSDKYFQGSSLYDGKMVVFGIQGAVKEIVDNWNESFFSQPKKKVIARYKRRVDSYLGEGVIDVSRMAALHDLGYLPVEIKSIAEGERIPMKIPMLTIKSTIPEFYWVVNYLEPVLSNMIWKGCTNATIAFEYKRVMAHYADITGASHEAVLFQGHDFSSRGMSGAEDACRSGAAHLTSFLGSDSVGAIDYVEDYYGHGIEEALLNGDVVISQSIPATEHAVSSSNIIVRQQDIEKAVEGDTRLLAETMFLKEYITKTVPSGFCSYVADTYDYFGVLTQVLPTLKDTIMARDGRTVVRPDSGDPVDIICGTVEDSYFTLEEAILRTNKYHYAMANEDCEGSYNCGDEEYSDIVYVSGEGKYYELTTPFEYNRHNKQFYYIDNYSDEAGETVAKEVEATPEMKGSIQLLWEIFGGTVNDKGYKELDPHIGLIYGDSITIPRAEKILHRLKEMGFASTNVVFGVGSYTYQMSSRDTFGTAMKATATAVNKEMYEIYKDPATGDKLKKSARGLLRVDKDEDGEYSLTDQVSSYAEQCGELRCLFFEGGFYNLDNIEGIRERLENQL